MIELIEELFTHFVNEIYPHLEASEYKASIRDSVSRFKSAKYKFSRNLSLKKGTSILEKMGYGLMGKRATIDEANEKIQSMSDIDNQI